MYDIIFIYEVFANERINIYETKTWRRNSFVRRRTKAISDRSRRFSYKKKKKNRDAQVKRNEKKKQQTCRLSFILCVEQNTEQIDSFQFCSVFFFVFFSFFTRLFEHKSDEQDSRRLGVTSHTCE